MISDSSPADLRFYFNLLLIDRKVKTLGAEDSDEDDSATSWVIKSRKKEQEKILAEKRVSSYCLKNFMPPAHHLRQAATV